MKSFPDGLIAVVKRDCPTCTLIEPVLRQLAAGSEPFTVYSQDDPVFPAGVGAVVDDSELESSYHLDIDIVPTLIRMREGKELARTYGWDRRDWESLSGVRALGTGLPDTRPGCGSKIRDPGMASRLAVRFATVPSANSMRAFAKSSDAETTVTPTACTCVTAECTNASTTSRSWIMRSRMTLTSVPRTV